MADDTQTDGHAPADALAEMLRGDQRLRWLQGQRVPVEAYFEHYPELRSNAATVQHLLLGELQLRRELGEALDLDDFRRRFPAHAEWLGDQFEHLKKARTSADGQT